STSANGRGCPGLPIGARSLEGHIADLSVRNAQALPSQKIGPNELIGSENNSFVHRGEEQANTVSYDEPKRNRNQEWPEGPACIRFLPSKPYRPKGDAAAEDEDQQ